MDFPYKIKTKWQKTWSAWTQEIKKGRFYLFSCLLLALFLFFFSLKHSSPEEERGIPLESMDTHIPLGFVLVPIEVFNKESLSALLGSHGVVDLFLTNKKGRKVHKIAHHVKMLRAPLDPHRFAILVPEKEAVKLLKHLHPSLPLSKTHVKKTLAFISSRKKAPFNGFLWMNNSSAQRGNMR